ncbi:MAG: LysM peptidoglycan-binding domain-containing protein [candidate division Zixibacteria bacterium]|nr:LysM peptidoglycan-binding domain-containing protein [candidate division Zixibacteria bacterium]
MLLKRLGLFFLLLFLLAGCSSYRSTTPNHNLSDQQVTYQVETDTTQLPEYEELKEVERYYAAGVDANREARWLDAQDNFEKALEILSGLDIDEEQESEYTRKVNMLLKEIAQEYKVTLISLGTLDTESSISAFLEKYKDIENFKTLQKDTVQFAMSQPDTVTYDLPIEWNRRVENSIIYFQTIARGPFTIYLQRSGKYIDLMRQILKEKGLPVDLAYLPMIESGYNPRAYSWARAVGPWQFISSTGRRYNLKRNWWYDERRDFVKSTYAAANYLKFLYGEFKSWHLALAAYNCGEGNISRAIKKYKTRNFWELNLKRQTADYVPLFMAATIIAKNPSKYGFGDVKLEDPIQYDVVRVNNSVDLKVVAQLLDVPVQAIRDLNPEILRDVTPPNLGDYLLRIPAGTKTSFENGVTGLSFASRTTWIEHKVQPGETVSSIAKKYKTSPFAIIDANRLGKKYKIIAGSYLRVPTTYREKVLDKADVDIAKKESKHTQSDDIFIYIVKKGDTLLKIAKAFGVTTTKLVRINNLKDESYIFTGQRLKIPVDKSRYSSTEEKSKKPIVHVITAGDTLWGIAVNYGVSLEKILKWNKLKDPSYIRVGDKIRIYQ